jgi:DnaK suppressor protein
MNEHLSAGELRARQAELQHRYQSLRDEIQHALNESGESDFQALAGRVRDAGEESVADLISGLNFNRVDQLAREVVAVEIALSHIRDGSYGICAECGNEIDPERLRVMPAAQRCIECQAKHETEFERGGRPTL